MSKEQVVNETDVKPVGHYSTLGEVIEYMKKSKLENVSLEFDVSITFYHYKTFSLDELVDSVDGNLKSPLLGMNMEDWIERNNDINDLSKTEHDVENFSLTSLFVNE
jgi:hypothetical protein